MGGENEGNRIDGEGEEFFRDYHDFPPPPRKGPQLRKRGPILHPPLRKPPPQPCQGSQNIGKKKKKKRENWSHKDMREAINLLDCGYKMHEVCEALNILRSPLRDHYNGRIKGRKMGPKSILTKEEEDKVVDYVIEMGRLAHPWTPNDLKLKIVEIC